MRDDDAFIVVERQVNVEVPVVVHTPAGWFSGAKREEKLEQRVERQFECIFWQRQLNDCHNKMDDANGQTSGSEVQIHGNICVRDRALARWMVGHRSNNMALFQQVRRLYEEAPRTECGRVIFGDERMEEKEEWAEYELNRLYMRQEAEHLVRIGQINFDRLKNTNYKI
jgi:hypothetical protein